MTMNIYNEKLRSKLNKFPLLKKAIKISFGGVLRHYEEMNLRVYRTCIEAVAISREDSLLQREMSKEFSYRPLISIIVPTYNTPETYFFEMIESVIAQTYDNWELIIIDDASPDGEMRNRIERALGMDSRIKAYFLKTNHHISEATNEGIRSAQGEFVALFDHDDTLRENALYEVAVALNHSKALDFLFTDEAKTDTDHSTYTDLFFKPDWNPDMLRSINCVTHFSVIRKSLFETVGYLDGKYNGAQDWELFLRIFRFLPKERIHHIPKILYSWRVHALSTAQDLGAKPYVIQAQRSALEVDLQERGHSNYTVSQDATYPAQWRVSFAPRSNSTVTIMLIGGGSHVRQEDYIRKNTNYSTYEIVHISNDLSYSTVLSNLDSNYIVTIRQKIMIHDENWLTDLVGDAEREEIGFVISRYGDEKDINHYIRTLLSPEHASLVISTNVRALSKHFYTTTRYNVPSIGSSPAIVAVDKLRESLTDLDERFDERRASEMLAAIGYLNLYNPYVKMVK